MKKALNNFARPLKNQDGFGIIILVSIIAVTVISYSLYASNYFLVLTSEVKQSKRVINGISVLQQMTQAIYRARVVYQKEESGGFTNCDNQTVYTQKVHELCVPTNMANKATGICIANPFADPPTLCVTNAVAGDAFNIIEVTNYEKPEWYKPYTKPVIRSIQDFNFEYGKRFVALAENLSNRAIAYPEKEYLPDVTGGPTLTKDPNMNKNCNAAAPPSEECMSCRGGGGGPGVNSIRPECFTFKICLRADTNGDGFGDCDPAIREQWVWQMIAVTQPIGP